VVVVVVDTRSAQQELAERAAAVMVEHNSQAKLEQLEL
jgi:hypothetical protein